MAEASGARRHRHRVAALAKAEAKGKAAGHGAGRRFGRVFLGAACLLAGLLAGAGPASAEIIYRERSMYQNILLTQTGTRICLQFSLREERHNQSCIDQRRPKKMVFTYTRMMTAALLLNPAPRRALIAGLGGGTLPSALAELFPKASIDVVEIDPAVAEVAERFFGFAQTDRLRVQIQDARVFVKRALEQGERYDLIMLDAFTGDYIPEHLMTREFLNEARSLLTEDGILAANTFAASRLYDHESATYRDVFGPFFNLRMPRSSNRVILASRQPLPSQEQLQARADALEARLRPFAVRIQSYPPRLSTKIDWNPEARLLTDQYSPANLLKGR